MQKILTLLRTLLATAYVTYKEWAAYRSHMLLSLFVGPVFFLVQISIWKAVYGTNTILNGLTLEQIITYFGAATLIYYLLMDFADWNLQMLIQTGKFLTFMLRPVSHRFFAFSQKLGHRLLGFVFEFLPAYAILCLVFRVKLVPAYPFWFALSLGLGFLMMFLVNYCVGITGFWLTRAEGLRRIFLLFRDILAGAFIPLSFFPEALQQALFFLPFQFITYVPIRVFLGSYELAGFSLAIPMIIGIQALAVLVMWGVSEVLWQLGIKRFTGVGA
jgi:ABC-2 type transport system permease protein